MLTPIAALRAHKAPFWIQHYNIDAAWPRIEEAIANPAIQDVLCNDLGLCLRTSGLSETYERGSLPLDYDPSGWARDPESASAYSKEFKPWWRLALPGATLWLGNYFLEIAKAVEPERPWRLMEGADYAAVFDGKDTLFDPHGLAVGLSARAVWKKAAHYIYPVGEKRVCKPCCPYESKGQATPLTQIYREVWEPSDGAGILLF